MSRIGKQPIIIPENVNVTYQDKIMTVKGPKGELTLEIPPYVIVEQGDKEIIVNPKSESDKLSLSLWGTIQRLIGNMITGVTEGYVKRLKYKGVGWRTEMKGKTLVMHLGYSHPIEYKAPEGIELSTEKDTITVSGIDKQLVGQVSAEIRAFRKPEPYKGKGIIYEGEIIRRKAGKQAKTA